ncbi:MAG: hypothetical protein ACR2NZ_14070 [Rubripirellula sp.]
MVGQRKQKKRSNEAKAVVKALQQANADKPRITLTSILLSMVLMVLVLFGMHKLQLSRMSAAASARADARENVMNTTTRIESASWRIRMWSIRHDRGLPNELSNATSDISDGWGKPMQIVQEGEPVSSYKICSAGEDGQFDTVDDVAIRFDLNHKQLERLNTFGIQELNAEMESTMRALGIGPEGGARQTNGTTTQ